MGPKGNWLRPTSDRVKESIFSIIDTFIVESTVIDLFAGTGSLGIEALSRGASSVTFVDNSYRAVKLIRMNVEKVDEKERCKIIQADAYKLIKKIANTLKFDLIFADPPYRHDRIAQLVADIMAPGILSERGILVLEHSTSFSSAIWKTWQPFKAKKFGDTAVSFFQRSQ